MILTKTMIYSSILLVSLTSFILQIFVFSYPDGTAGFLICTACIPGMIISSINLFRYSILFIKSSEHTSGNTVKLIC